MVLKGSKSLDHPSNCKTFYNNNNSKNEINSTHPILCHNLKYVLIIKFIIQ